MTGFRRWLRFILKGRIALSELSKNVQRMESTKVPFKTFHLLVEEVRGVENKLNEFEQRVSYSQAQVSILSSIPAPDTKEIELRLAELEQSFNEQLNELREHMNAPKRSRSSGRPFTMLRKIAEEGERALREKQHA